MERATAPADVLIVEDDQGCIDLISEVVADLGHSVVVCDRAEAALKQVYERPPVLVVLDVMLPDGDGFSVLTAIRQNPVTATTPVLLCTAALFEVTEYRKPVHDPYTEIVAKPFHIETFIAVMNQLLALS